MPAKKPPRLNTIRVEAEGEFFPLEFSDRDFSLLGGPQLFMPIGAAFIRQLGVFENTSIAQNLKIPPGSCVRRKRGNLLIGTRELLTYIERDADLLSGDYSFRLTGSDEKHRLKGELTGFRVRGLFGSVDAHPRGFCTLKLSEASPTGIGRSVELIDLRNRPDVVTDDKGTLKIYREAAQLGWLTSLPALLEFLGQSSCQEVVIHHR